MKIIRLVILLLFAIMTVLGFSQEKSSKTWDNQAYIGNKVAASSGNWRYSGELQVRLEDDMSQLDNWYLEGVATYMLSKKVEIVPDFRISIKPDEVEYRPGMGLIYKFIKSDFQFVNQLKWQLDMDNKGNHDNGLRYAIFINHKMSEKLITNFAFGAFYRWREAGWNGFQFVRFGPGIAYVINKQHTINFNYFISAENNTVDWDWAGIYAIQLIININKGYKYIPAKYISF